MNQSINYEPFYRTAPATPGLLNISSPTKLHLKGRKIATTTKKQIYDKTAYVEIQQYTQPLII